MADLTGHTLGQYTLGPHIGKGGMADVYRARQTSMDRDVAVKVMAAALAENEEFVARFEREARVIARLQHPHILPVIDFGRAGDHIYLVMRLVEGGVLSDRLRGERLSLEQVNRLLGQIASALAYAHQRGVIHRDLKPNNVLLDEGENVYLTDFGIAKMLAATTTGAHSLTATGSVMGTPAYMAPEQWRSEPVDARTDIYALGIILYEMLTGALPFQAETPFGMMYKHFDTPPPRLGVINPTLPAPVESVIVKALAKQPADRYSAAQQLADEFAALVQTVPPDTRTMALPRATPDLIAQATDAARHAPLPDTPASATVRHEPGRARRGGLLVWGALIGLVIAAAVIGLLVVGGGDGDDESGDPAVMVDATATDTPEAVDTGGTATAQAVTTGRAVAALPAASETPEITPSPDAPITPGVTRIPSPTLDLDATTEALLAARLTQTAESWTATPTPDIEASVVAALTGTAGAWTGTAGAWTATPSLTPTLTPTRTPTITPSRTPTATITPSRTPTATITPSRTPTRTRTPRPTATRWPTLYLVPTQPPTITPADACPMRPRLETGAGGRAVLFPPTPTRVRSAPGFDAPMGRSIPPGQTFWVLSGPECRDAVNWWQIQGVDQDGLWEGWIAEGNNGTYWLETFETGPVECPGAPPPRLTPGETGRITVSPPLPSRVRAEPNTAGEIVGQYQPGEEFNVVSGPVCDEDNGWRWWAVANPNATGWVAEGPAGEYWMEPWQ